MRLREAERATRILITGHGPPLHGALLKNGRELLPTGLAGKLLEVDDDNGGMPMTRDRLGPLAEGEIHHLTQPVLCFLELPVQSKGF